MPFLWIFRIWSFFPTIKSQSNKVKCEAHRKKIHEKISQHQHRKLCGNFRHAIGFRPSEFLNEKFSFGAWVEVTSCSGDNRGILRKVERFCWKNVCCLGNPSKKSTLNFFSLFPMRREFESGEVSDNYHHTTKARGTQLGNGKTIFQWWS